MRILDENNNVLNENEINYGAGQLVLDTITIEHPSVKAVAEQGHYVTVAEYPNGGKDVEWVVDVAGVEGCEAWTETEEIRRFVRYTAAELAERARAESIATATAQLRASDPDVIAALETIFAATSPTELIAAIATAAETLKETLAARRTLREQIAALAGKEE